MLSESFDLSRDSCSARLDIFSHFNVTTCFVDVVAPTVTVGDAHMNEPVYAPGVPPKKDGQLNKRTKIQGNTSPGKPLLG